MRNHPFNRKRDPEPLVSVLKKVLPSTCLPLDVETHRELADRLVMQLGGEIAMVPKEQYDRLIVELHAWRTMFPDLVQSVSQKVDRSPGVMTAADVAELDEWRKKQPV